MAKATFSSTLSKLQSSLRECSTYHPKYGMLTNIAFRKGEGWVAYAGSELVKLDKDWVKNRVPNIFGKQKNESVGDAFVSTVRLPPFTDIISQLSNSESARATDDADDDLAVFKDEKLGEARYEIGLEPHHPRIVSGYKGVESKPFRKSFKNQQQQQKWVEDNDAEVHQVEKDHARIRESAESLISKIETVLGEDIGDESFLANEKQIPDDDIISSIEEDFDSGIATGDPNEYIKSCLDDRQIGYSMTHDGYFLLPGGTMIRGISAKASPHGMAGVAVVRQNQ